MATILGSIALAATLALMLLVLRSVLVWMLIALLVAMVLNPAVEKLSSWMPRGAAIALVMLAAVSVAAGFALVIVPPFVEQASALVYSLPDLLERARASSCFQRLDDRWAIGVALTRLLDRMPEMAAGAAAPIMQLVGGLMRLSFAAISIAFLTLFMLINGPSLLSAGAALLQPASRARAERLWRGVYRATSRYAVGTGALALVAGAFATLTLAAVGVPFFLPLGASLVFLDLIPFVGAISGGLLLMVATGLSAGWLRAFAVLAVFAVYQQIEGHLLLPLVHHRTVRLPALGVAVALLIGYELGGILGVLVAVPLAGALRLMAHEILEAREARRERAEAPQLGPQVGPGAGEAQRARP
jgi:predicted PurR-regulated permease PerM